jgi:hypothetical protein
MSYDSKISTARQAIETHNNTVEAKYKVDFDAFLSNLQRFGGTSEEVLRAVTWEDLEKCGAPVILARRLAFVFREQGDSDSGKSSWVSDRKAAEMPIKELLERYNPREVSNPIANRLKALSKNQACIVFTEEVSVNVECSARLLKDLQDGMPPVPIVYFNDLPCKVYKIGECPDRFFDENPVYKGQALRSGETCGESGVSWKGVSTEIKQLIFIAANITNEIKVDVPADVVDLMEIVSKASGNYAKLAKRYPKAALELDSMKKAGNPPILKITCGSGNAKDQKNNNPFGKNVKY